MPKQSTCPGPEGLGRPAVELAGLRRRLASMLYETLLLLGVLALTFMVPLLILGVGMNYTPPGGVLWGYVFLVLGGISCGTGAVAARLWRCRPGNCGS